ncbi:hypothetical protein LZF95_25415 [Algoriphagus sp. AGSA1]|uniref:hypothetical protein n=1 Tax=Algoriphagus sp. AGSA1 TaxID=2907213 RepID=UPI001F346E25|nr:hypothetical protein [Algoriphagus sp. AGSA1]MCE7058046.1 hypothetical protein [Algoriphagus sp. AGSA1]
MKRSVLLLAIMMVSAVGFSQSTLKGPKAKNATAAERAANASPLKFKIEPLELKGPAAKNEKVWKREAVQTETVFVRREQPLKGPKAKNKKVWKD